MEPGKAAGIASGWLGGHGDPLVTVPTGRAVSPGLEASPRI